MRVLLVHASTSRCGGVEQHLHELIPALRDRGHEVALLHEHAADPAFPPIAPSDLPSWCISTQGSAVLNLVRDWQPDVAYVHSLIAPSVLGPLVTEFPALHFIHGYVGACISVSRCMKFPAPRPCDRIFGWACLARYYPRRCGGWNPLTLWAEFHRQRRHREFLLRFDLLLTHSKHVRNEYVRHGTSPDRIRCVAFFVAPATTTLCFPRQTSLTPLRLLYLGRFDPLKGGQVLLSALPLVHERLRRPIELVMAGDGTERRAWGRRAETITRASPEIEVRFPGWLSGPARETAFGEADVVVIPSLWPEPFGMAGVEAGLRGIPAVAFDVGGIRAWLKPGVSGHLASGSPPTRHELADAIARTTADTRTYRALSAGAFRTACEFSRDRHLEALEQQFEQARELRGEHQVMRPA
jgi:glycosyltransferase involved in cell wall biosynthesis